MKFNPEQKRHHYWFEEISRIPRASYNEKGISDFVCEFAKEHGLEYYRDEVWNVFVFKPASKGAENASPLILQAHMDMVPAKKPGSDHDFAKDPIELVEEDGWLKAKDTTLGGDDGIGVAWMLSILEDETMVHPALECIFSVQEEVGLGGALAMKPEDIRADRLISLDSMDHDVADLCCSGGCYIDCKATLNMIDADAPAYRLHVGGLAGGHSGVEIHLEKGNANVCAVRILEEAMEKNIHINMVSFTCGSRSNAIPPECDVVFVSDSDEETLRSVIAASSERIRRELDSSDPGFFTSVEKEEGVTECADEISSRKLLNFLYMCPNGFMHQSMAIEGLTVTSLNLGAIHTEGNAVCMQWLVRSMFDSAVYDLARRIRIAAACNDVEYSAGDFFPGWEYAKISPLRDKFAKALENHGGTLKEVASHGGLEVGIFASLHPGIDITTVGAVCRDYHTYDEKLDIDSFDYGFEILKDMMEQCTHD